MVIKYEQGVVAPNRKQHRFKVNGNTPMFTNTPIFTHSRFFTTDLLEWMFKVTIHFHHHHCRRSALLISVGENRSTC